MAPTNLYRAHVRVRVAVGVVLLLAAPLAAPGFAASLPDSLFTTNWYTVSVMGNRSGYSCQTLRREASGVESFEQTVLRVKMGATVLTAAREERRHYDANLRLLSIEHKADQVGRKLQISVIREGDKLRYVRTAPDGETRQQIDVPANFGQELEVLQAITRGDVRQGWKSSFITFDCDLLKLDTVSLNVIEPVTSPRAGWLLGAKSKLLDLETRTWIAADGTLLRQEIPGMMGMCLQLATEQEALAQVSPLLMSTEIPVDRQMGEPSLLKTVTLRARARTGSASDVIPTTPRQTIAVDGQVTIVTVQAETLPELTAKLPIRQSELQPYLQASDLAQSQDPQIRAKAQAIVGGETDAWQAALKLLRWVYGEMAKVDSEPRPVSATEILKSMRGDCTEHAILYAALAQAVGRPVKLAAGLAYADGAYHYHAWNEVYVGRWVEVDPTWGEETVDAGHLQISSAALDETSVARLSLASGKTMGSLELQIVAFQGTKGAQK